MFSADKELKDVHMCRKDRSIQDNLMNVKRPRICLNLVYGVLLQRLFNLGVRLFRVNCKLKRIYVYVRDTSLLSVALQAPIN